MPVDEEVRMLRRYFAAAYPVSLQTKPVKECCDGNDGNRVGLYDIGKFAPDLIRNRREWDVFEGTARAGIFEGLKSPAIFDMALHFGLHRGRIARRGLQQHVGDDLVSVPFEQAVAVGEPAIRRASHARFDRPRSPVADDAFHFEDAVLDFSAKAARIAEYGTADRSRQSAGPGKVAETPRGKIFDRIGHLRSRGNADAARLPVDRLMHILDDQAVVSLLGKQHVRACAEK